MIDRSTDVPTALRRRQGGFLLNPYRFAGAPTDPDFSSVAMLLHMDGTNGSTTFTDSSSFARTMTAVDEAQISTAQSKFGGASGLFDGEGTDRVTTPFNANIDLTSGDFTIEGWFRPSSLAAAQALFAQRTTGGMLLYFPGTQLTNLRFLGATGGTTYNININTTGAFSVGTWTHFAVTRSGNTWRIFRAGLLEGSASVSGSLSNLSTQSIYVGADSSTNTLSANGHIDDFRITKGIARYTADFTPPTTAFPNS